MTQRSDWNDELITVPPQDKRSWNTGEKPPAQFENWYHRAVVEDIADLASRIFLDEGDSTGNIKVPAFFGSNSSANITVEVGGAGDMVLAYNASYDAGQDSWFRDEDTEDTPAMLVRGPSFSGLLGISAGDVGFSAGFIELQASSVNGDEITWELADKSLGQLFLKRLLFDDASGDGNNFDAQENGDGHLEIQNGALSRGFFLRKDGYSMPDTGIQFPDLQGNGNHFKVEPDGNGNLLIKHPALSGDIKIGEGSNGPFVETDGQTGDPGEDDRLTPRGWVQDQLSSTGTISNADSGTVFTNDTWVNISFNVNFNETPILLGSSQTSNGGNPPVVVFRNVSTSGAQIKVTDMDGHSQSERLGWLAFVI